MLDLAKAIKPRVLTTPCTYQPFAGQTMAMIFTKPSTRTRVSFETGIYRMGGHSLRLGDEVGIGKREATKDVARVLASMNNLLMARLHAHGDIVDLAKHSQVPVINGLTDHNHPCQIMADALTIEEVLGTIEGKKVVYVGDGNNIVHSWIELAKVLPFDFVCACPEGFEPNSEMIEEVGRVGKGTATVVHDPKEAVKGADVIYADVWVSMGQHLKGERDHGYGYEQEMLEMAATHEKTFMPYQINEELMAATGKDETMFLHCLPAERGRECTDGVLESDRSFVFQQAENRMHAQNALMVFCCNLPRPSSLASTANPLHRNQSKTMHVHVKGGEDAARAQVRRRVHKSD